MSGGEGLTKQTNTLGTDDTMGKYNPYSDIPPKSLIAFLKEIYLYHKL